MPGKYDNYDWDELPEEAKKAAQVLGYNKVGTSWLQVMRGTQQFHIDLFFLRALTNLISYDKLSPENVGQG